MHRLHSTHDERSCHRGHVVRVSRRRDLWRVRAPAALAHQCAQALDRARLYVSEMRAKNAIAAVQRRQASVLEAIADGFVTFDREWRFGYVNRVAAELLNRGPEDLVGRVLWDLYPGTDDMPFARVLGAAMTER